jgi:hypothetical protein
MVSGAAFAQTDDGGLPNDPLVNEDANACYAGGSLEGKCALDGDGNGVVDDYEADWAWNCGWHVIRLDAGMIGENDVPAWCAGLVNYARICYTSPISSLSLQYIGPPNTGGNLLIYGTSDCTGPSASSPYLALIYASTNAEANAACLALDPTSLGVAPVSELFFDAPSNVWMCVLGDAGGMLG